MPIKEAKKEIKSMIDINKDLERVDILNDEGYKIIQNPQLYCFNMDAVLISDFAKASSDDLVLDIGSGNAIIPLLMHSRYKPAKIFALEIQETSADLARRSVFLNNLESDIEVINDDAKNASKYFKPSSLDVIVSNPPYMEAGLKPRQKEVSLARHETALSFEDLASVVAKHLKVGGAFYLVHRTYRLVDVIATLRKYKLEPKEIRFVKPYKDKEANVFLLKAVRGAKPFLKLLNELIVYEKQGIYTQDIKDIYKM